MTLGGLRGSIQLWGETILFSTARDVFTPQDAMVLHRQSREFLTGEFSKSFDGTTVVMTHHAPSDMSVADRFKGDALSPAFASDLNHLIDASGSALWVHGHVHDSFDYHIGQTRVVCNPRGYYGREVNPGFSPNFVVEI